MELKVKDNDNILKGLFRCCDYYTFAENFKAKSQESRKAKLFAGLPPGRNRF